MTLVMDTNSYIEMMKKMNALLSYEKQEIIARGLRDGVTVIAEEGKRNYMARHKKADTGKNKYKERQPLLNTIGVLVKKKDNKAYAGFKRPSGAHAHLIDRGTKVRTTKKGWKRGSVKASHFWKDAIDAKKTEAMNKMEDSINKAIETIMR